MSPDEIEAARIRAVAIIEKNTRVDPICISCREPIRADQPILESIHGPYHDLPLLCVEGRPGESN